MQQKQNKIVLAWFTNDLRVQDNSVLELAKENHNNVIALYCFDPRHFEVTQFGFKKTEKYRAKFLLQTVSDLKKNYQKLLKYQMEKLNAILNSTTFSISKDTDEGVPPIATSEGPNDASFGPVQLPLLAPSAVTGSARVYEHVVVPSGVTTSIVYSPALSCSLPANSMVNWSSQPTSVQTISSSSVPGGSLPSLPPHAARVAHFANTRILITDIFITHLLSLKFLRQD